MKSRNKSSGIGGQAVMEGIMMKNKDHYAVAVRKPDQTIAIEKKEYKSFCKIEAFRNLPLVRGMITFVDSLMLGMSILSLSASFFEEEAEEEFEKRVEGGEFSEEELVELHSAQTKELPMGLIIASAVLMAVGIFFVLPFFISLGFQRFISSVILVRVLEGFLRLGIFISYILVISKMEDIRRVFMYHGAEHKCINCIEHGLELNLENVRKSSKEHKRCGTSFLFFVIIISMVATMFIQVDSVMLRLALRLLILPLIAGISYEIIRLAGNSDHPVMNFLSKPGLLVQGLTTKEPDETMIEVGIASVEAVFDWREYQESKLEMRHL